MSREKLEYVEEWECSTCEEPCTIIARRSEYYGHVPQVNGNGDFGCVCECRSISAEHVKWVLISFAPKGKKNAT